MAITYTIDRESGIVLTTAFGVVTDAEALEHKQRLTADPEFRPDLLELADVRGIVQLEVTPAGVETLAEYDAQMRERYGPGYRLAIVAADDAVFGMARMYEMRTEAALPNVSVFRDLEQARAWLGLTRAPLPGARPPDASLTDPRSPGSSAREHPH